jgi:hypothetical protein
MKTFTIEANQLMPGDSFTFGNGRTWHEVVDIVKNKTMATVLVRTSTQALVTLPWKELVSMPL